MVDRFAEIRNRLPLYRKASLKVTELLFAPIALGSVLTGCAPTQTPGSNQIAAEATQFVPVVSTETPQDQYRKKYSEYKYRIKLFSSSYSDQWLEMFTNDKPELSINGISLLKATNVVCPTELNSHNRSKWRDEVSLKDYLDCNGFVSEIQRTSTNPIYISTQY